MRAHVDPSGMVPTERKRLSLISWRLPLRHSRATEPAKGMGCCWKHVSVSGDESGQSRYWSVARNVCRTTTQRKARPRGGERSAIDSCAMAPAATSWTDAVGETNCTGRAGHSRLLTATAVIGTDVPLGLDGAPGLPHDTSRVRRENLAAQITLLRMHCCSARVRISIVSGWAVAVARRLETRVEWTSTHRYRRRRARCASRPAPPPPCRTGHRSARCRVHAKGSSDIYHPGPGPSR